jgi:arylsulfatase A-like enzyme
MGSRGPNVLILMTDQHRADALGCYGSRICRTPRLDQLAAQGVRFARAYTPSPICSPARASLLTGLWPTHHGMIFNSVGRDGDFYQRGRIPDGMPVLGRLFQEAGYRTYYVGKWHVGKEEDIRRLGFAEGPPPTEGSSRAAYWPGPARYPLIDPIQRRWLQNPTTYSAVTTVDGEEFREIAICRHAQRWLREHVRSHPDEPFLCFVSTPGPHWPCVVPERYAALYDWRTIPLPPNLHDTLVDKPAAHRIYRDEAGESGTLSDEEWQKCLARYYAFVTLIDEHFGEILDTLDELGAAEQTLVVYLTDHGDIMGSHRLFDKGPFMYEEMVRIPLIMRWPGRIPTGQVIQPFVSLLDVLPTLLEAADIPLPPKLDGRSLWPLLRGETVSDWPESVFSQFHGHGPARGLYDVRMLRTERYKFVYYPHDSDELYDEQEDPWELTNLAEALAWQDLREQLQEEMLVWMQRADDPLRIWMKRRPRR